MSKLKMGVVTGESGEELRENVIKHLGLGLPNDSNVGRKVRIVDAEYPAEMGEHFIVCRQKCWGYDNYQNYTMIDGYRIVPTHQPDAFGRAIPSYRLAFI